MSFNVGNIFSDISSWIGIGSSAANKAAAGITEAVPIANAALGAIGKLVEIGKGVITKPDPTPEHIAEVDALRGELVAQANALRNLPVH